MGKKSNPACSSISICILSLRVLRVLRASVVSLLRCRRRGLAAGPADESPEEPEDQDPRGDEEQADDEHAEAPAQAFAADGKAMADGVPCALFAAEGGGGVGEGHVDPGAGQRAV